MRDTFYLDGIDAADVGIFLQRPVAVSGRVPEVEKTHVQGRNGDIVRETGAYENMTATASCFALQRNVSAALTAARNFLFAKHTYRRLVLSHDPEHFLMARIANGAQVENRLNVLNPFEIEFDCKPQFFLFSGEQAIDLSTSGNEIVNIHGGVAKPLVVVHGSGSGTITIGTRTVQLTTITDGMVLDCDSQNAYNGAVNLNGDIYAPEFPVLDLGSSVVAFTGGVSSLSITPRWWD